MTGELEYRPEDGPMSGSTYSYHASSAWRPTGYGASQSGSHNGDGDGVERRIGRSLNTTLFGGGTGGGRSQYQASTNGATTNGGGSTAGQTNGVHPSDHSNAPSDDGAGAGAGAGDAATAASGAGNAA